MDTNTEVHAVPASPERATTEPPNLVLYVDDDPTDVRAFVADFGRDFSVVTSDCAEEALTVLRSRADEIAAVVAGARIPGMSGTELLEQAAELAPDAQRMVVTARTETKAVMCAVNRARIARYYGKPWDRDELGRALHESIEAVALGRMMRRLHADLHRFERAAVVGVVADEVGHALTDPLMTADLSTSLADQHLATLAGRLGAGSEDRAEPAAHELLRDLRTMIADARGAIHASQEVAKQLRSRRLSLSDKGRTSLTSAALLAAGFFSAGPADAQVRVVLEGPEAEVPGPLSAWVEILRDLVACVARASQATGKAPIVVIRWHAAAHGIDVSVESREAGSRGAEVPAFRPFQHVDADGSDFDLAVANGLVASVGGALLVGRMGQGAPTLFRIDLPLG